MAAPTAPTLAILVAEALYKAGYPSPAAALTTRAQNFWMEEIKADIWEKGKRLKPLMTSRVTVLTDGLGQYSRASDFEADAGRDSMELMWGDKSGTATAGTTTSITFPATAVYTSDIVGQRLAVTGGTGSGQLAWITAYNATTRVVTLAPALSTAPDATSTYLIVGGQHTLQERGVEWLLTQGFLGLRGDPRYFAPLEEGGARSYLLAPVPYRNVSGQSYVVQERYHAHLLKLDLAGTVFARCLLEWRVCFEQGLIWKTWQDDDDTRAANQMMVYQRELRKLVGADTFGNQDSGLQIRVRGY